MEFLFEKLTFNIKNHSNVILMTHRRPDLDGMGSAIALSKVIESMGRECYIIYPDYEVNSSLENGVKLLKDNKISINFKKYNDIIDVICDNSLLIVLDTQRKDLVECEELLERVKDVFVIDHHCVSSNKIEHTVFEYINANKSSTVEIICEYIRFLNKSINNIIATILSTGMEVDTHSYTLKTTEETFRIAGFLTRMGADPILKKEILRESMEAVIKRNEYVKNSYFIKDGFLLCDMGDGINTSSDLAILADELLKFSGVFASFAVGNLDSGVGVSARSLGTVDVSAIMHKLGGGGHVTDAAAQFKDMDKALVIKKLKEIIMEG